MKIRKVTALLVSLAMVLSSLSFLAAFAKATDSITYTAYGAEDAVVAVEDFRLDGPGDYTVFIPAETERIVFSVTTKDNAEPDFTPYGNEIATDGLTAEAGFTVEEEVYSLLFVKQNDENKVIENIEIIAVGAGEAETALEFEFDAYRRGADVRNNVKAPSDTVALKFNITAKEGAAALINGEAPEESYAINTKYPVFYIEGALGQLIYDYKICVAVEGVSELYELALEYGFGEESVVKKINLFTEGAEYIITAPMGVQTVEASISGLLLRHKNHSELAGLDADGAFSYEDGVTLEAVNGSGDVIFTITLEDGHEAFPDIEGCATASYKGGELAGRKSFSLDLAAPEIKFYNLADTFDVLVDFGYPYGYDVMVGEEVYPGGLGIPAAEGDALLLVTAGDDVYALEVTLKAEAFLPSLTVLTVTPLDANGNETGAPYTIEGLETETGFYYSYCYHAGTAKFRLDVTKAEFCETVQMPYPSVAVESFFSVTLLNENGESEYRIIFIRDDTIELFGIGVDFKDADGVLIKNARIEAGGEIIGDPRAATVDFYVYTMDLDHTVTVNGVEAVSNPYGYYKATLDADMQSPVAVVSVFDEQNKSEVCFNYVVPPLSPSAELTDLTVTAIDENGEETAATVDFENGFIILPEGAVSFKIETVCENAYKELSYGGRLFEEGEVLTLSEGDRLVIRLLSEDGSDTAEYSFCFNHGEYLTGIYLDGKLLEGFSPEITDYLFDAPEDKESATLSVAFPEGTAAEFEPEIVFIDGTVTATITVTGAGGAATVYYLSFKREIPLLSSETLLINRETGFISGLTFGMKLTDLKALFDNPAENIKFYKNGEEVENGNVATGIEVALVNGNGEEVERLALVLYGDISGDGKINTSDILAIVIHNNSGNLTGAKLKAADPSGDGKVNSTDILRIILFNNGGTINQNR